MTGAFDADAFDPEAFDTGTPPVTGGKRKGRMRFELEFDVEADDAEIVELLTAVLSLTS